MPTTTNPGVTPADIEAAIASEHYFTAGQAYYGARLASQGLPDRMHMQPESPLSLLTFCVLVTHNGHTVSGEAHCQDPAKFDATTGQQAARANAIDKLWPMVVFSARQRALDLAVQP